MRVFVLSTGRSGTLAVARQFGLYHEPPDGVCTLEDIILRAADEKFVGEIGHHLLPHMHSLKEAIPDAIFIHLVRDGRQVVKSFQRLKNRLEHTFFGCEGATEFERLCKMWYKANSQIEGLTQVRVRIEDLTPFIERVIPRAGYSKRHEEIPWTTDESILFEDICGEMNERYGYA